MTMSTSMSKKYHEYRIFINAYNHHLEGEVIYIISTNPKEEVINILSKILDTNILTNNVNLYLDNKFITQPQIIFMNSSHRNYYLVPSIIFYFDENEQFCNEFMKYIEDFKLVIKNNNV